LLQGIYFISLWLYIRRVPTDTTYKPEQIREALRLLAEGVPATKVALTLTVPASTVRRWKTRYAGLKKTEDIAARAVSLRGIGRPRESK
jgi:DNA invertase Pin-like site-specific DNA recombinase